MAMRKSGFEILQYSLCEGWINNLYDGNADPYVFTSIEDAIAELQEEFDDWQAEIEGGDRDEEDGYDISTFQIRCNEYEEIYELDLIDGRVIAFNG